MVKLDKVLIVGAGIVGQVLACSLAKRNIDCEIVEIKDNFDIAGAGIIIQGTGLRALLDIGIVEEMGEVGFYDPEKNIHFLDTLGEVVLAPPDINIVGEGYPSNVTIRRQAFHEVLHRRLEASGVPLRMGTTIEALDETPDGIDVSFSDGTEGAYSLVIGCDGLRSKTRDMVFPGHDPEFAGFCNWRLVLPRPDTMDRPLWLWGHGKTLGIIPVSDTEFYFAGVGKASTTERPPQETVADTFRQKFACFGGPVPDLLKLDFGPEDVLYTVMEEVRLPAPWHKGRVVIMGDAAHAACPFWAQGGSMGIEDAVAFADELEKGDGWQEAVAAWFDRRYERAKFVQDGSFETGQNLTRDEESDEPKFFPPPVREMMAKQGAETAKRLAAPF